MKRSPTSPRGIALIEALVALAVMAFGMLGVAVMQASLRQNSDLARQRAEAVRLAQSRIELLRAYSVVAAAAGRVAYADALAPLPDEVIVGTNATFTRQIFIAADAARRQKTVDVTVSWADRANVTHNVRFSTVIHRVPPEISAAVVVPGAGTATQNPLGRHPSIPQGAVPDPGGLTSTFTPPQPPGPAVVRWVFNNTTGFIVQRCSPLCGAAIYGRLLQGYVAFSTGNAQPTPAQADSPSSDAMNVGIQLTNQTLPNPLAVPAPAWECFVESLPAAPAVAKVRAYYCMIKVLETDNFRWSARSELTGLALAGSVADDDDDEFRVCRYTPYRNNDAVGTGVPPITNADHPRTYASVDRNLVNQNFLVIRAGDDSDPFDCPVDLVPAAPAPNLINSNTWHHQPAP